MADQNFRVKRGLEVGVGGTVITTTSNGSVGLGTTNPLQRLQIGTANTLGINTTGTVFVITSNADVGIGTTNPTTKLDVRGNVNISGVVTATTFVGTLSGFASTSGVSTSVIGGIASVTQLSVTGVSTFSSNIIQTSGSVGLGTTNPLQRLQIGTANTLGINTTGTVFVVTSNADVGIGTTNPISKLHVIGDVRVTGVITANSFVKSGGTSSQFLKADGSVDSSTYLTTESDTLNTVTTRGNSTSNGISVGVLTATSGNFSGIITSSGLNVSGVSTFSNNIIQTSGSVGLGTTNPLQTLQVGTANTLGINTTGTVFVVTSNADVGIGTTNPTTKLDVRGNVNISGVVTASSFVGTLSGFASTSGVSTSVIGGIASVTQLSVSGVSTFSNNIIQTSGSVGLGTTNPLQRFQIGTANTLGINTTGTVFVVTSNADVGIGTTNPTSKLHVIGDVRVTGVITASSFSGTATSTTNIPNLTGDITSNGTATSIASGVIVNDDINASAGIVDTKLATISTAGKVLNSATTATNANTASAIVARDASGNFSAGTITANLTGTASTASFATTSYNLTDAANITTGTINSARLTGTYDISISGNAATATYATSAGVSTSVSGGTGSLTQLQVTGISTFTNGPVFIGAATSTGTASQPLQVTGGAYVSGNLGIGTTDTSYKLDVIGRVRATNDIDLVSTTGTLSITGRPNGTIGGNYPAINIEYPSGGSLYALYAWQDTGNDRVYQQLANSTDYFTALDSDSEFIIGLKGAGLLGGSTYSFKIDIDAETSLYYNQSEKLTTTQSGVSVTGLTSTTTLNVGTGGTVITTTASGLVGIGTTNPRSKLDVRGAITVGGAVSITAERDSGNNDVIYFNPLNESRVSIGINTTLNWSSISGTPDIAFVADKTIFGYPKIAIANPTSGAFYELRATYSNVSAPYGYVRQDIYNGSYAIALDDADIAFSVGDRTSLDSTRTSNFGSGNEAFVVKLNGSTSLFHNKSKKFETSGVGVTVTGTTSTDQLIVSGVSTFTNGPVLIGSGTSTGTASQRLQVTGGAYVSGNIGAAVTSPSFAVDVSGDTRVQSTGKMRFGGTAGTTNFYIQYNSSTNSLDFVAG